MKRAPCLILAVAILFLTGCSAISPQESIRPKYQDYREIPGVTQEDIDAVEALRIKKPTFVYGLTLSTEAFYEDDDSLGGFAALLYGRMSELFGFEFKPYVCNWDELVGKIGSEELDFTSEFTATPERAQKYFMTDTIIQRSIKLFTNKNADLQAIAKSRPVRCAFMTESTIYALVNASWDMPFEPVFVNDESKIPGLFLSGEIDAYIDENVMEALFDSHDYIRSEEYYPLAYSPVSLTTGNPELKPIINIMQKYLQNGGFYELAELYTQGGEDYSRYTLSMALTDEEKDYIQRHNEDDTAILMACEINNYPMSFFNAKENEFEGISLDVLNQISALSGLNFKAGNESDTSWPELLEGLENGKYSIVTELLQTNPRKGRFLWTAEPYYVDYYAMISRADYPDVDINRILFAKTGLLEDTAYTDVFLEWFPNRTNTVMYLSKDDACAALEKGEIDLLMVSQNFLLHLTNYLEKPGFKTNVSFNYSAGSFFGLNKDEEILCSIINKAQAFIDINAITQKWQKKVFDYQAKMLRDMVPYEIFVGTLLLAALLVVILLFIKNKRISKNLEKLVAARTNELSLQTSTLTTIFESIPDIVFCKDVNSKFTRCNRSFEEHFGCLEADIIGKGDFEGLGVPKEIEERFAEADRRVMRERRMIVVEETIPSANGSAPFFETMKTPLMQDGAVIGIMGISRNISRRKAAEEALKLTLDNLNTCVYITEIETGKILFVNKKMAKEYDCEEYHDKICWDVLQVGATERCGFCPVTKLLESGDEYYVWEEHSPITGRFYSKTDSLIQWHDGRLVHMQHSIDITDSVKLRRALENASKAKSDFLSRMSHEIRTPLNAIIGMINIAMITDDNRKIKDCLDKAGNASKHLLGVINDILDMSKIEANKFELSYDEFDFEKALMNITNVVNFRAEEKRQNLVVNLSDGVPAFIFGDELRLSQVITNLLSNAVKFTPENGTVLLNIKKTEEADNGVTLQIDVVDNGIGISEEQQKRLFTSFEQADGSISRKFGGTGLGLAISKRIVELMGGRVWIESELGKGSKFSFTIKVKKCGEKTHATLSPEINQSNIRILAVDDSEETRICFSYVMEAHGLPCDTAASGGEALERVRKCGDKPYNIFFIDWQMPEMDGIELTKRIKEITGDHSVVFMISVADWNNIEEEALSAGVKRFVPKPLFPSTLIDAVNECLGAGSKKSETPAQDMANSLNLRDHTILIAEDVEINQEIMTAVLEETGVAIDFADDGEAAVSMFRERPQKYSLILMDIHMPGMDGYEATRAIRALGSAWAKDIPIIAMTANVFREDIDNCLSAGMNDHIGKPVEHSILFEKLRQYLL